MDLTCWGSSLMRYWANFWSWSLWSLDKDSETGALRQTAEAWTQTHEHRERHTQRHTHTRNGSYLRRVQKADTFDYFLIWLHSMSNDSLDPPTLVLMDWGNTWNHGNITWRKNKQPKQNVCTSHFCCCDYSSSFKSVHSKRFSKRKKILHCGFWRGRVPPHGRTT